MATYTDKIDKPETESHQSTAGQLRDDANAMVQDVKAEVQHEAKHMYAEKEPVDPTQSDHVVRHHVTGLSITFFIAIALFLLAVIASVAIYTHSHH
jgi:Fe2+ transport system protein B